MSTQLQQAIAAIKEGDNETGKRVLAQVVRADPHNEEAWLWLAQAVSESDRKRECYRRVLALNPNNDVAQRGLILLYEQPASPSRPQSTYPGQLSETPQQGVEAPQKKLDPLRVALTVLGLVALLLCGGFLAILLMPSPAETPSQLRTTGVMALAATETLTATPTPQYVLTLPQSIKNSEGWVFTINRIDFLRLIEGPRQRHKPENGIFLWIIGTVTNSTDKHGCIRGQQFVLRDGAKQYTMSNEVADSTHSVYGLDYPGFILGQCLDYDKTVDSFLIFDVPIESTDLWLKLDNAEAQIGPMSALTQATPIPVVTPKPKAIPLPAPTHTRVVPDTPSHSPTPVSMPGMNEWVYQDQAAVAITEVDRRSKIGTWEADSGFEFLSIAVTYANRGANGTIHCNPFNFRVMDSGGIIYDHEWVAQLEPQLKAVDLAPSATTAGWVTFQVPIGDNRLQVLWQSSLFASEVYIQLR